MLHEPTVGSTVGGYRIVSLIARGGMGAVYLAEDPLLDRRVALKIPAPELVADQAFRDRFLRETKLAASLEHQAIVPVYATGEDHGTLFLALRYVDGADLATLIGRSGPLEAGRLVHLLDQVASALDAAHAHGLVHRDVKSSNILVGTDEQAYLSDFGLTKRRSSGSALTRTGQFVGTLDYVAPEMIEGRDVTGAADQYSLACVAFEALTGAPPFKRETDAATLYAHLHEPPPRIDPAPPGVSQRVDEVLRRGMAKQPGGRFPTCRAFVEALDRALATPSGAMRDRRALWVGAVALIGAVLVLLGVVISSDRGAEPPAAAGSATGSIDEERLLTRVPSAIRPSCDRTEPGELLPPASLASVTCIDDAVTVTYSLFDTARAMDDWLNQSIGIVQAFPGDCASDRKAEGEYAVDLVRRGRVLCYVRDGSAHIEWTDEGLFVLGAASRDDLADLDLYEWWGTQAGPLEEGKDVPELDTIPDGTYTMTITPSDHDDYLSTHDFPPLPEWFGRWVLQLEGGEYRVVAPVDIDSAEGPYVSAKGDRIVFYVDGPTFCAADYVDTFAWETTRGRLRLSRSGPPPDCGGADPPPWDLHPWTRIT